MPDFLQKSVKNIPKVSIIVPCHNQAEFLSESLESVINQSISDWECIIVNDGSTDNTEEIAKKWCDLDYRFAYIKTIGNGVAEARNIGIKKSKGTYILPLDADDKISSKYLYEAIKILDYDLNIKIVYGQAEYFGDKVWKMGAPSLSM